MPGGRPTRAGREGYPELAELAAWFDQAIREAGHPSVNAFVQQHTLDKNKVYEVVRGTLLLSLNSTAGLARLLKQDPSAVEPIWLRAREAMDRRLMAEDEGARPRVTSWAEIPRPELALRNVLDALTHAVEQLPYRLLGVAAPPLSTVYVRQRLRADTPGAGGDSNKERDREELRPERSEPSADVPVTVAEALNRSEHLLVTGEPGAGKSTLGHHLVSRLARIWLRQESAVNPPLSEPVVPVRVSARALVGEGSWSTVLAEATRRALGPYLVTEPSPHLFAGRTHGVRWLVVVDGLDEILDRPTRASIIRALSQHARAGSDYRFVITSRPLPEEEMAALRGSHIGMCRIEPFEQEELKLFSERWFFAQDPITSEQRAQEFLHQIEDGRLKELVRNPLLATIAAVANTREPERPLPTNRVDLYQRFYEYLVTDEEASGRATLSELRRLRDGQPGRFRLVEWIHAQRTAVIEALAKERLTTELPLSDVAYAWVRERKPAGMELSPGWERDFDRLLIDTGMFVYESSGLRFLHHTFAEFIAARAYATSLPADFPGIDEWIERGLGEAQRNFALLTMVLWGRINGNDVGLILDRLLEGDREYASLAGRLLSESSDVNDRHSCAVVDRLIDLGLGNAPVEERKFLGSPGRIEDRYSATSSIFDILGLLSGNAHAVRRLRGIVEREELPFITRIIALEALSRVESKEESLELLKSISHAAIRPIELSVVAVGLIELGSDSSEEARELLVRASRDSKADSQALASAAEALRDIGEISAALHAARSVLTTSHPHPSDVRTAVKLLLNERVEGDSIEPDGVLEKLSDCYGLALVEAAKEFVQAGHPSQALLLARSVLHGPDSNEVAIGRAADLWLSLTREDSAEALVAELSRRQNFDEAQRALVAEALAEAGYSRVAGELASGVLVDSNASGYAVGKAAGAWLAASGSIDGLLDILRQRSVIDPWSRSTIAEEMAEAGHIAQAVDLVRSVFSDPVADTYDLSKAVKVVLRAEGSVRSEIFEEIRQVNSKGDRARVAFTLAELGYREEASSLVIEALGDFDGDTQTLKDLLDAFLTASGVSAADAALAALNASTVSEATRFAAAEVLASAGALSAAVSLWCGLLTVEAGSPTESVSVLTRLLNTGHRDEAIHALRSALDAPDLQPHHRGRLRSLLSWAVFSDPNASNCGNCP
ncbi:hypothetical protein [Streptomyces sp. NPDC002054]|uniref:NACHT domain-containing protein n=1 Tax=Streptomyces sp. NPDC002054 TaxID=3154663 RepID=UPI003321376C